MSAAFAAKLSQVVAHRDLCFLASMAVTMSD